MHNLLVCLDFFLLFVSLCGKLAFATCIINIHILRFNLILQGSLLTAFPYYPHLAWFCVFGVQGKQKGKKQMPTIKMVSV
jgi:hypothetical protein